MRGELQTVLREQEGMEEVGNSWTHQGAAEEHKRVIKRICRLQVGEGEARRNPHTNSNTNEHHRAEFFLHQ